MGIEMVPETSVIFNQVAGLIALEDFTAPNSFRQIFFNGFSIDNVLTGRGCSVTSASQLHFRKCYWEGARIPVGTERIVCSDNVNLLEENVEAQFI
jgi:hypothetical protein